MYYFGYLKILSSVQCANINSFVSSNGHGKTEIVPTVQNVVSAVNLNLKLDLKEIAKVARNTEYNPNRFHALIMRIRDPRTTALVFATGKLVCTGAKSEEDSKLASRKFARIIQKLGFNVSFQGYKIHNIVGSCDVRFPIRLESFQLLHANFSHYEPELFPGLVYRMVKPKVVMLIFASGKVVITGAKIRENLFKAFENILPILKEFQKIVKNKDDLKDFKEMLKNL